MKHRGSAGEPGPSQGEKALSITVGYVLNLAIMGLVVSTSLLLVQGVVEDVRGNAAEEGLSAAGQVIAGEIESVDTLANPETGVGGGDIRRTIEPPEVEGAYSISIEHTGAAGFVNISSNSREATASVEFDNSTAIQGAGDGINLSSRGEVTVRYDPSIDRLVIEG